MSERTNVVVELPLDRLPEKDEMPELFNKAVEEARKLIGPGRILGLGKMYLGTHAITSQPNLIFNFAVEAPEALQTAKSN